jgi:hypothetical protein
MNETTRVLDESRTTATSPEEEQLKDAAYDVRVAADAAPHAYKALPSRPARPNFMDFFAPRRRQPTDPAVPRYTALAEPPADISGVESPITSKIQEAWSDQSNEKPRLTSKG